jgi:tRNA1Val (adenine37-N6)-methyltransferase
MARHSSADETLDAFLDGTVRILQKKSGYRFSVDAVLLSRFIRLRKDEKGIDLGTGCGILPILLSRTGSTRFLVGVEVQAELANLARKNVELNGLTDRITIIHQDLRQLRSLFPGGSFHVVFSNPPYRKFLTGRVNPSSEKAIARHEIKGTLADLIQVAAHLLPTRGRCYLIYPASRAIDLLTSLRRCRLEPKRLQFVHPDREAEAKFVLVESVKGSGPELKVEPPLILEDPSLRLYSQ